MRKARNPHRASTHHWFADPTVEGWRHQLHAAYRSRTHQYLVRFAPHAVLLRRSDARKYTQAMLLHGRAGHELDFVSAAPSTVSQRRRGNIEQTRVRFSEALDVLMRTKSWRSVTVAELVRAAGRPRYAFYGSFASGLNGTFCFWASTQLDLLTVQLRTLVATAAEERRSRALVKAWAEAYAQFVLERPFGRLSIHHFLAHEIDVIGVGLFMERETATVKQRREQLDLALQEFAELAAALHRSAARLISTAMPIIEVATTERSRLAREWRKEGAQSVLWNMALSFWLTTSAGISCLGFLEAEREAEKHRNLVTEIWLRAAMSQH